MYNIKFSLDFKVRFSRWDKDQESVISLRFLFILKPTQTLDYVGANVILYVIQFVSYDMSLISVSVVVTPTSVYLRSIRLVIYAVKNVSKCTPGISAVN